MNLDDLLTQFAEDDELSDLVRMVASEAADELRSLRSQLAAAPDFDQLKSYVDQCHAEIDAAHSVIRKMKHSFGSLGVSAWTPAEAETIARAAAGGS